MRTLHFNEKSQFKDLFAQNNIDRFEDRYAILETFLRTEQHVTVDELVQRLADRGHRFSRDFVRDTLDLMLEYGFAHESCFDPDNVRYEHRHLGQHHDHLVCTKCHQIMEFSDDHIERRQEQVAAEHGFHLLQHRMALFGICQRCMAARPDTLPLTAARTGERLVVDEYDGGTAARLRLRAMGLRVGDTIDVISNRGDGQVVVASDGKRYALGRGLAEKVRVRPAPVGIGTTEPAVPLSRLRQGQSARIRRVGGAGPLRRRLLEMGLINGVEISVEKYAPLQDPMELIVRGYHISLRVEEAEQIIVEDIE